MASKLPCQRRLGTEDQGDCSLLRQRLLWSGYLDSKWFAICPDVRKQSDPFCALKRLQTLWLDQQCGPPTDYWLKVWQSPHTNTQFQSGTLDPAWSWVTKVMLECPKNPQRPSTPCEPQSTQGESRKLLILKELMSASKLLSSERVKAC